MKPFNFLPENQKKGFYGAITFKVQDHINSIFSVQNVIICYHINNIYVIIKMQYLIIGRVFVMCSNVALILYSQSG